MRLLMMGSLALIGCAQSSATIPTHEFLLVLEQSAGPFCGQCELRTIILAPDGRAWLERGWWAGDYSDWRTSTTTLTSARDRNERIIAELAPYRPEGERSIDESNCANYWTDQGQFTVEWRDGASIDRLRFDRGCFDETALDALLERAIDTFVSR